MTSKPGKFMDLPSLVPYDEIHLEAQNFLKAENFEKALLERTAVSDETKIDLSKNLYIKVYNSQQKQNAILRSEPHTNLFSVHYTEANCRAHFLFGNDAFLGASYIRCMTSRFSLGCAVFRVNQHHKYGVGYAARFNTDKLVVAGQIGSGIVSLGSILMYKYMSRDVTGSFGYDYILGPGHLRGYIDSNGYASATFERGLNLGLKFILRAKMTADLKNLKKDIKYGITLKRA